MRALPRSSFVPFALLLLLALAATPATPTDAQAPPAAEALAAALRDAISASGLPAGSVGVTVIDVDGNQVLFEQGGAAQLNPASNAKIVTAAAALSLLGPEMRITTTLAAALDQGRLAGPLALRGRGDPTLRYSDLLELATQLAARGVRRVDNIVVDDTYFDADPLPPAFEQQPNEMAPFRAAIGAASLDANAYRISITPGEEGAPARIDLVGAGYFQVSGSVMTSAAGTPPDVRVAQTTDGNRLRLRVGGTVPAGVRGVSYARRVELPWAYTGWALADALGAVGIRVGGTVTRGPTPRGAAVVASHVSPPLSQILLAMGKDSDNFTAEMVLRLIAAQRARTPGTSAEGARLAGEVLQRSGAAPGTFQIRNGSGLFDANRYTSNQLAGLLAWMARDPTLAPEYIAHLAVAGVDGTLENRLRGVAGARRIRAKTGTLDDAISLSGYVFGTNGRVVAFSVMTNSVRGRHGPARALCDRIATATLEWLQ